MNRFSFNLKSIRVRCGLTQQELSDKIGVSKSTISMYENGNRTPDMETLLHLAKLFNVSIDALICANINDFNLYMDKFNTNREELIRSLIKERGLSIKSFSQIAEIPYTTLHSMLDRGIGKASFDNVIKVCKALGITVDDLEKMSEHSQAITIETIAAHAVGDLSEESIKKIIEYAKLIKLQEKLEGKDKE